jgi:hypothetical protein
MAIHLPTAAATTACITDQQWHYLMRRQPDWIDDVTADYFDFTSIESLLLSAQEALTEPAGFCPPRPELGQLVLWNTSSGDGEDFILTVDLPGWPSLTTATISFETFQTNIESFGTVAARAVLDQLLHQRALLIHDLAHAVEEMSGGPRDGDIPSLRTQIERGHIGVYEHDQKGFISWRRGHRLVSVILPMRFEDPLACAAVHELNNAVLIGSRNGGSATYRRNGAKLYARCLGDERLMPIYGLSDLQAAALADELTHAAELGAARG